MYKNGNEYYHKIDCPELKENGGKITGFSNYDFQLFNVTISNDGTDTKMDYWRHEEKACYYCIVGNRYESENRDEFGNIQPEKLTINKKNAYYTAVGREKYRQYATTNYFGDANK